ncbi:MAG: small-conductance mechanosensitive channel [Desulfobulbales bacterium]
MQDHEHSFNQKIHFWGRLTIAIAIIMTMSIPLYLTFVLGFYPDPKNLITGLVTIAGFVGVVWFVEPVSYFPILGPAGTYMSFLTGNIGNMRLPVISAVQNALDLEAGTKKAEVAGIFALISSVAINLLVLGIVVVAGQFIVAAMPKSLLDSFNYALPGILGAMLVMFAIKMKLKHTIMVILLAAAIAFVIKVSPSFLPKTVAQLITVGDTGVAAVFGIALALFLANKNGKRGENHA